MAGHQGVFFGRRRGRRIIKKLYICEQVILKNICYEYIYIYVVLAVFLGFALQGCEDSQAKQWDAAQYYKELREKATA